MRNKLRKFWSVFILVLALSVQLGGCAKSEEKTNSSNVTEATTEATSEEATSSEADTTNASETGKGETIIVGVAPGPYGDLVKVAIQPELEKRGYKVEFKEFSDYV